MAEMAASDLARQLRGEAPLHPVPMEATHA
jgi:hypothetical protein